MKLPYIKKATWETEYFPGSKWVVVEREYNTYDACMTLCDAIRYWLWHLGVPSKIAFRWFKNKRNDKD